MILAPPPKKSFLLLGLIFLVALWFRFPTIKEGMPFFYNEDEAHHFNRVVNMVKAGDFNPHYFHKPSLHFYLRMPVVALSFIWNVKRGKIRELKEIRTQDRFGVGQYAFSASHVGIVKWNRAFSTLMSLILLYFTYLIAKNLAPLKARHLALAALIFALVSPELIRYSSTIGVDVLMSMLCVAASYVALRCFDEFSGGKLFLCSLLCGLAVSSKYNALPVCVLPTLVILLTKRVNVATIFIAILVPIFGFFLGSPYILVSIPLFLDQFAYEIWHYAVAGHEGHSAEPGIAQFIFYTKWLASSASGILILVLGILGAIEISRRNAKQAAVLLSFPILYFLMMVGQRANFTRNMLVVIPYIALLAPFSLEKISEYIPQKVLSPLKVFMVLAAICIIQPLIGSLQLRSSILAIKDSRSDAETFLNENFTNNKIAIAGQLQFAPSLINRPNVEVIDQMQANLPALHADGFDVVAVGGARKFNEEELKFLKIEKELAGDNTAQRIPNNPAIQIASFNPTPRLQEISKSDALANPIAFSIGGSKNSATLKCLAPQPGEDYCWILRRMQLLDLSRSSYALNSDGDIDLHISAMSPWPDQVLSLRSNDTELASFNFSNEDAGKWRDIKLTISAKSLKAGNLFLAAKLIFSPFQLGLSQDKRNLAIAIK